MRQYRNETETSSLSRSRGAVDTLDEETCWRVVLSRDPAAGRRFVYAVVTTGVFCRPGCTSRVPRRDNVRFFAMAGDALRAGFRPCRRCRPDASLSPGEWQADVVEQVCRRIDSAEETPTVAALAESVGISVFRLQRVFKAVTGVTPKAFISERRARKFRDGLAREPSVTAAIYDAGFGSSSRAYEGMNRRLGMAPQVYRRGGEGISIHFAVSSTSLGWIVVASTARGICCIEFIESPDSARAALVARFPRAAIREADPAFATAVAEVAALIETPARGLDLPLDIQGTAFQLRVWNALTTIPPGETTSYAEIAHQIGYPSAARAVGAAIGRNPVAVAVPCHRVVRSDGGLSGYHWGTARKIALQQREGAHPRGDERDQ